MHNQWGTILKLEGLSDTILAVLVAGFSAVNVITLT